MSTEELIVRVEGRAGRITLNRPKALNALSYPMVIGMEKALLEWADDPAVSLVIIDGAGDRALCAGGDIDEMYQAGLKGDFAMGKQFWHDEYRLNAYTSEYPKPYVAFMDGFVMGGGVGISSHSSHRIVTEKSVVAMPECSIGLIPDVGGTHLLAKAPGYLGEFAGLTGHRMNASDAIYMDFADCYVTRDRTEALKKALCETGDISVLKEFTETPEESTLSQNSDTINAVFSATSVGEIIEQLEPIEDDWAEGAAKAISRNAPLSLISCLELIRGARQRKDLRESLSHEFRFTTRAAEYGEFLEGIRAAIIDKDRNPQWKYPTLNDVPDELIEKMLAPVEGS